MRRLMFLTGLTLLCGLLCACGGSTTPSSVTSGISSSSDRATSTAVSAPSAGDTSSVATVANNPPGSGSGTSTSAIATSPASSGGVQIAHVPATFTVGRGDSVNPLIVSAPVHVPIELAVISGDGRPHRVRVRISSPRSLTVPARGRASVLLSGLAAGRYIVEIDGVSGAALDIGGEPAP